MQANEHKRSVFRETCGWRGSHQHTMLASASTFVSAEGRLTRQLRSWEYASSAGCEVPLLPGGAIASCNPPTRCKQTAPTPCTVALFEVACCYVSKGAHPTISSSAIRAIVGEVSHVPNILPVRSRTLLRTVADQVRLPTDRQACNHYQPLRV